MSRIYALLVGIDDYPQSVGPLAGCVRDVEAFHDYLRDEFGDDLAAELLTDADATRGNVVRQVRDHLGRAGKEDVALFVYCGHGARWAAAGEFHRFYPEAMDEGLVLVDSRRPGGFDLADKELAVLLAEIARREPHLAVILDSCHSGSGTRGLSDSVRRRARQTHTVTEERPLASYLDGHYSQLLARGEELRLPASRHVSLAACERWQRAYEDFDDEGRERGLFSLGLLETLAREGGVLSYADLFLRCRRRVSSRDERQTPQFDCFEGFDASRGFLDRDPSERPPRYRLFFDQGEWRLERGALHGLPLDAERGVGLRLFSEEDPESPIGGGETTTVGLQSSRVTLDFEAFEDEQLRAEITSLPVPGMPVVAVGEPAALEALETALAQDSSAGVELVRGAADSRYEVRARESRLELRDREVDRLIQGVAGADEAAARMLLEPLRQVAAWERGLALSNPRTGMDPALVELRQTHGEPEIRTVASAGERDPGGSDRVTVDVPRGRKVPFTLEVRNGTAQTLHMALFCFTPAYGVAKLANDPVPAGAQPATLFSDTYELAEDVGEEVLAFKLVVSTEKVDDFLLEMEDLELGKVLPVSGRRGLSSLERDKHRDDWFTETLEVRLVREGEGVGRREVSLAGGRITVRPHPSVTARAGLAACRSLGRGGVDEPVRQLLTALGPDAAGFAPLSLDPSRAADGAAHVLELVDLENEEALSDEPLEIVLDAGLGEGEYALPLTFDGRHVLLAGAPSELDDGRTLVRVDRVPDVPSDRRSLAKALKLYFVKTFVRREAADRLRWVEFRADGSVERHDEGVGERLAAARNVLLVVHGILGDTEKLAEGLRRGAPGAAAIDSRFDLVLTYDYENLATPIEETAGTMAERLASVGLDATAGKRLTILAHSMGGLVSRWWIEQGGGEAVVDHLVMCGTPNAGSPFGSLVAARRLATVLTTWALNYLPGSAPYFMPLLFALNGSRKLTPTLEQMAPTSEFLARLNASPPSVATRYTALAGNVQAYHEGSDGRLALLLAKAAGGAALETLFGTAEHDVAVRVDSVLAVEGRGSTSRAREVSCLHTNYLSAPAGLAALSTVEW